MVRAMQDFAFGCAIGATFAVIVLVPLIQKYAGLYRDAERRIDNLLEFEWDDSAVPLPRDRVFEDWN